jgi:hypothetical protein
MPFATPPPHEHMIAEAVVRFAAIRDTEAIAPRMLGFHTEQAGGT